MFESAGYGTPLEEQRFERWLEKGRSHRIGYQYLIVLWNQAENDFHPVFMENRPEVSDYVNHLDVNEELVAIYDLYSESRILISD